MSKDEKIWIPDNYYKGLLRSCLANELIEETPSKTALENAGCDISALCYLITPDGKQHNPRIMKPNELSTSIRKLFETRPTDMHSDDELQVSEPDVKVEEIKEMLDTDPHQVCDTCSQSKPLQAFKRYPGRSARYRTTCIECQTKEKELMPEFKQDTPPTPESMHKHIEEEIQDAVVVQTRPTSVMVTLDYLKRLATEAYERGREYERSNIETIKPSLEELLGIVA